MQSIRAFLSQEHADCDERFVAVEAAVQAARWAEADGAFGRFAAELRQHFLVEEEVLFPAVEGQMGGGGGPTEVMRIDHEQMRALLGPLEAALRDRDADTYLGLAPSLLLLLQQHNMKEEQVLYPMADEVLPDPAAVVAELRRRNEHGRG